MVVKVRHIPTWLGSSRLERLDRPCCHTGGEGELINYRLIGDVLSNHLAGNQCEERYENGVMKRVFPELRRVTV